MLVLEDVRDGAVFVLELEVELLSLRRKLKLANLERAVGREDKAGRGACSTGFAPFEGRKQLNGMVVVVVVICTQLGELQQRRRSDRRWCSMY